MQEVSWEARYKLLNSQLQVNRFLNNDPQCFVDLLNLTVYAAAFTYISRISVNISCSILATVHTEQWAPEGAPIIQVKAIPEALCIYTCDVNHYSIARQRGYTTERNRESDKRIEQ